MSAWRLRYALMLTDSLSSILFDARRNTCHCLLLNYWVRCGGLQVMALPTLHKCVSEWQSLDSCPATELGPPISLDASFKGYAASDDDAGRRLDMVW